MIPSKKIFRETCQWLKFLPNGLRAQSRVSPVVGLLPSASGPACLQHVNRMPRNRLPRVMKHYSPTGRRNHGRPLKRLLDAWYRNGPTSGPTPWQIYDDDDDDDDDVLLCIDVSLSMTIYRWNTYDSAIIEGLVIW
jgi:hypothetical protein